MSENSGFPARRQAGGSPLRYGRNDDSKRHSVSSWTPSVLNLMQRLFYRHDINDFGGYQIVIKFPDFFGGELDQAGDDGKQGVVFAGFNV